MTHTAPPPLSSWEFRVQAKHTAKPAPVAPVTPVQREETPKPTVDATPDYAGMHRAEIACLTERMRIQRTQERAKALFARIAANPAQMYRWGAILLPPTIAQTAAFSARMEHGIDRYSLQKTYRREPVPMGAEYR